ncbi:TraB/GumN family protein [Thiorhodococcus mannitoliphagus]|uniref:TraB/GumN family protein n=1 Tax=Thiorhodococcus mannitoliphagus TaxID=329406 RepID=UPI001F0D6589|nr:TraB/GumN family protein [Thiorhodococcus mannitoliphagus]
MTAALRCQFALLVLLLGLFLQPTTTRADSVGADEGLLFEVKPASSAAPSYLFGTIHSEDPRVTRLPAEVQAAFNACPGFALEVVPDTSAIIEAMMTMTYTDGRQLRDVLPAGLYAEVREALAELSMGEEAFKDFKPWAVMTQLSTPRGETGDFLDVKLYREAVAGHKRIAGLETMEEQLAIFDDLEEADQIALLEETLDARGALPRMFEQLTLAYLQRDLKRLQALSDASLEESEPRLAALFRATVIDARNRRMASRMIQRLDEGGWFVAIGALHLTGETGVVGLLRGMGYSVRRVY